MAEEQSEINEAIMHQEAHTRPVVPINPTKRARMDQQDATLSGVSEGSVTLVGTGLINTGLSAEQEEQQESELELSSESEAEDAEMDEVNTTGMAKSDDSLDDIDTETVAVATSSLVVNAKPACRGQSHYFLPLH
jgi:hypothetical protein